MSGQQSKALYRRLMEEGANRGELAAFDEIMAPDLVEHEALPPGIPQTRDGVKQLFGLLRSAFPDLHVTIEDEMADRDMVAARITFRGTHRGEFAGIPATGRTVAWGAVDVVRVRGGRIVEHWGEVDRLSLLQQLGVIPRPGAHS